MFLSEWRKFLWAPCLVGKKTWWELASRCCWNCARPWHASELVSFLVGLRTYQHPGTQPWNTKQQSLFLYNLYIIIIVIITTTAIELSLGGSSPYTGTDKIIKINIHKRKIQKHSTNNKKLSKYKYTYYQNTRKQLSEHPPPHTHTLTQTL